jgi:hypothetical protein
VDAPQIVVFRRLLAIAFGQDRSDHAYAERRVVGPVAGVHRDEVVERRLHPQAPACTELAGDECAAPALRRWHRDEVASAGHRFLRGNRQYAASHYFDPSIYLDATKA